MIDLIYGTSLLRRSRALTVLYRSPRATRGAAAGCSHGTCVHKTREQREFRVASGRTASGLPCPGGGGGGLTSTLQVAEQPSPFAVLPSSQASPKAVRLNPSPQSAALQVEPCQPATHAQREVMELQVPPLRHGLGLQL